MLLDCEPDIREVVAGQYLKRDGHAAVPAAESTKLPHAEPREKVAPQIEVSRTAKGMLPKTCRTSSSGLYKVEKSRTRESIRDNPDAGLLEPAKARGLIELHGGRIGVESRLGHGIATDLP